MSHHSKAEKHLHSEEEEEEEEEEAGTVHVPKKMKNIIRAVWRITFLRARLGTPSKKERNIFLINLI